MVIRKQCTCISHLAGEWRNLHLVWNLHHHLNNDISAIKLSHSFGKRSDVFFFIATFG